MLLAFNLPTRLSSSLDHVISRSGTLSTTLIQDCIITDFAPIVFYWNKLSKRSSVNTNVTSFRRKRRYPKATWKLHMERIGTQSPELLKC